MSETIWRGRASKHERRYRDVERFPYVVRYGNEALTSPIFCRTYAGARLRAWLLTVPLPSRGVYSGRYPSYTIRIVKRSA